MADAPRTRRAAVAVLRETINKHGLAAAHREACRMTARGRPLSDASAEELLCTVLERILSACRATSSLFANAPWRPKGHPLAAVTTCPECGAGDAVSLPAYPADRFDCEACGHSWALTPGQRRKMIPR